MSRNQILLLMLVADLAGAVVIVSLLPLTTSLVVLAVYVTAVYYVGRALMRRPAEE